MCGILFALAKPHHHANLDKWLADAFIASQVRGTDSAGLFRVTHEPNNRHIQRTIFTEKAAVNASTFLSSAKVANQIKAANHSAITVGHVRARTHGAVKDSNAHPFEVMRADTTELVGVHNGSMVGWKDMKEGSDYDVDSEWMLNCIADDGIKAFKGFDGAYALVWYDTAEPGVLNVARNDKRPLYFAWTKDKKGMLAASELGMLGWLADRNEIELWKDDAGRKFFFFSPHTLYKINLETLELSATALPKYDAVNNPYKLERPPVVSHVIPRQTWMDPYAHKFNQDHVVSVVEKIILEARNKRAEPAAEVVSSDDLADGGDIAAQVHGHLAIEDVEVGKRFTYAEGISAATATQEEINLAKSLGYYGLVGKVWPYYHDEETSELLCSFAPGNASQKASSISGEFKTDAGIRVVTTAMVKDGGTYCDKLIDAMHFAVVGVRECKPAGSAPFPKVILTEVKSSHRLIQRRVTPHEVAEKLGATVH